ncbi:glucocorticoid-induced transcript 1 protein isoform X1 [Frankliniella occidentalis]|uniref:Glucocorticoid-induced transcript 1 protein isoform X1 n=1 Tax=Frankliniella occidentalis TaxID=133901 RepID=A0A6J1SSJ0_FRAOC|nr:glucocorticoid-induced transcript 1 protein isoform X1 [Frankliniella occidentalis]
MAQQPPQPPGAQGPPQGSQQPLRGRKSSGSGPMRATLPMASLLRKNDNSSPSGLGLGPGGGPSLSLSPTAAWRALSGQRSPGALATLSYKAKSKTLSGRPSHGLGSSNSVIRRTASLDTLYLQGQWPRDSFNLQVDKATQTEDWLLGDSRKYRYDYSCNEDKLEKYIRHRLQRTSKEPTSSRERTAAFGLIMSPNLPSPASSHHSDHSTVTSPSAGSQTSTASGSPLHKAMPVNIPTWKQPAANRPPMRSSIEGLNQEIERLVLKGTKGGAHDQEREEEKTYQLATPEGHRAPLADMLRSTRSRSVNTQTPAGGDFATHSSQSSGPPSRESASPLIAGVMELSRPPSESQVGSGDSSPDRDAGKLGTSPHINKFLAREPPDGCEKVNLKFVEDNRRPMIDFTTYGNLKPCVSVQFKPSLGSAFMPLQTLSSAAHVSPSEPAVNGTSSPDPEADGPSTNEDTSGI